MKLLVYASVALITALSTPVIAQNRNPPPASPPASPPAQAPATAESSIRTERTVFDSWIVTCQEVVGDAKSRRCSAALSIVEEQSKRVAFVWLMGKNAAGAPTAVFTTPTGVNLVNGLDLRIGKGKPRRLSFSACDATSCEAVMPLDEGVLRDARTGDDASASITMKDGRTVQFSIINKGFDKALAAVRS
jgi:invasion protein IalB